MLQRPADVHGTLTTANPRYRAQNSARCRVVGHIVGDRGSEDVAILIAPAHSIWMWRCAVACGVIYAVRVTRICWASRNNDCGCVPYLWEWIRWHRYGTQWSAYFGVCQQVMHPLVAREAGAVSQEKGAGGRRRVAGALLTGRLRCTCCICRIFARCTVGTGRAPVRIFELACHAGHALAPVVASVSHQALAVCQNGARFRRDGIRRAVLAEGLIT
jgi:hypothetical protein